MNRGRIVAIACGCALAGLWPSGSAAAVGPSLGVWHPVGSSIDGTLFGFPSGLAGRVSAVVALPGRPPTELVGTLGGIWEEQGTGPWKDVTDPGWPSTAIGSLAVDPTNPNVVYAGTGYDDIDDVDAQPGAGVLKSTDGGRTWASLAASEPLMRGFAVTGLVVEPRNDRVVIAAANNGVFRSADGGQTWSEVLPIAPNSDGIAEVRLTVDPTTGVLLAGIAQSGGFAARSGGRTIRTGHAVYRSVDGGKTWKAFVVDTGRGAGLVLAPAIATRRGRTYAYALDITGGRGSGLYTSTDGGRSWQLATTDQVITKFSIGQLVVDPQHPRRAYFAQSDGPFQYTWGRRNVATVTAVDGSFPAFGDWRTLAIGPAANGTRALYGGHDGGTSFYDFATRVFTNNDAGLISGLDYFGSAQSSTVELSGAQDLGIDAFTGASEAQELWNADAYGVLIDRKHPATYYASVYPPTGSAGYVVSRDAGATWNDVALPNPDSDIYSMSPVQAAGDPNVLILPAQDGTLYVSRNDGASWKVRTIPGLDGDYVTTVAAALIPQTSVPVIYAGTGFGSVWGSSDLGASWSQLNVTVAGNALSVMDIAIDPTTSTGPNGEHVFVAFGLSTPQLYSQEDTAGDVVESSDSGANWSDIGQSLSATSVQALLLDGSTLFAGTNNGVEKYSNGSWSSAGTSFPNVRVMDLFLSADQSAIFATTYGRGTLELILVPAAQGGHGPSRPRNHVRPLILGSPWVGGTLTSTTGKWSGAPRPHYHFQWQRCMRRCVNIAHATNRSYTLVSADRGARVRVLVRASNRLGSQAIASRKVPVRAKPINVGGV